MRNGIAILRNLIRDFKMPKQNHTLTVNLDDRSYPIIIGYNNLDRLGKYLLDLDLGTDIFLITNNQVGDLYAETLVLHLRRTGITEIRVARIPDGEQAKTIANWEQMLAEITNFDNGLNRRIAIVNLGGGVVGDLGGFVAATYKRGINFVQVPTTLLANVDSGVGGKVAVNFKQAKNLIGCFYQPRLVYVDLSLLRSLPLEELRAGLAEVVKYGVIADSQLFNYLEENCYSLLGYDRKALEHVVIQSYKIKAQIVEVDERDTKGIRAKLNYGHTFAHAIEAASDYALYRHGEAVAIGMLCAAELANQLGMFPVSETVRLENLLLKIGLPTRISGCTLSNILDSFAHDKKFVNKKNRLILPCRLGEVVIKEGVDEDLINQIIARRMEG